MAAVLALSAFAAGCSPSDNSTGGTGGSGNTTFTNGGASVTTGGQLATGGSGVTGGAPGSGGVSAMGGASVTGGLAQAGQASNPSGGTTAGGAGKGGGNSAGASPGGAAGNGSAGKGGAATGGVSGGGGKGGAATGGAAAGGSTHSGPWRITPFGDSITATTCYPQLLSKKLKDAGRTNFSFVGSFMNNQSCSGAQTVQTEGHSGYKVTDLVSGGAHASELAGWCTTDDADIVLFHYGTNDAWTPNIPIASMISAYTAVLQCLRGANPNVIVFVAKILPMHPEGCTAASCQFNQRVIELNNAIPGWATSNSTGASPIYVVDVYSAFNADQFLPNSTHTADGVHPNAAGAELIAGKFYDALLAHSVP